MKARIFKDDDGEWTVIRPGYGFNPDEARGADRWVDAMAWLQDCRRIEGGTGTIEQGPSMSDQISEVPRWTPWEW